MNEERNDMEYITNYFNSFEIKTDRDYPQDYLEAKNMAIQAVLKCIKQKKIGWIQVYRSNDDGNVEYFGEKIYNDYDTAKNNIEDCLDCVSITKIEWEE